MEEVGQRQLLKEQLRRNVFSWSSPQLPEHCAAHCYTEPRQRCSHTAGQGQILPAFQLRTQLK